MLVVGAGAAGLEAARALGQRGYTVLLAEATATLGGRALREATQLPGHGLWRRVVDWRTNQIKKSQHVTVTLNERVTPEMVQVLGVRDVLVATGSHWRRDGVGRSLARPLALPPSLPVFTPDDVVWQSDALRNFLTATAAAGKSTPRHVLVFDDDHYYLGGAIAELLAQYHLNGAHASSSGVSPLRVTLATPMHSVSAWTEFTLEQARIHRRLDDAGVGMLTNTVLCGVESGGASVGLATLRHALTDKDVTTSFGLSPVDAVVLVTERIPNDALFRSLAPLLQPGGLRSLRRIGDCEAPGIIANAVFSGHKAAREFGIDREALDAAGATGFLRER